MLFGGGLRRWLGILAFCLLFPLLLKILLGFVIAPIHLHRKHRMTATPVWTPTTPEQFTPEAREFIARIVPAFRAQGFETVANVHMAGAVQGVDSAQMLFVNREAGDFALAFAVNAKSTRSLVLGVNSQFADGLRISTISSLSMGYLPRNSAELQQNFSWVRDPALLCEASF